LLRSLAEADPGNPNPRIWLGESIRNVGNTLLALGDASAGRAHLLEAAATLESIVAADPADFSARTELAQTYCDLGKSCLAGATSNAVEATSWYEKARRQYLDLRREGKLAPSTETLLTRVDEEIARLGKGWKGR
jgi:tetratricopeptide (TPR) repeat protein